MENTFGVDPSTVYLLQTAGEQQGYTLHGSAAALLKPLLPSHQSTTLLSQFQVCGLINEIWIRLPTLKVELWREQGRLKVWVASGSRGQPDDLLDQLLSDGCENEAGSGVTPVIASVSVLNGRIAMASLELLDYRRRLIELEEGDSTLEEVLEPVIVQLGIRELLVSKGVLNENSGPFASLTVTYINDGPSVDVTQRLRESVDEESGLPVPPMSQVMARCVTSLLDYVKLPRGCLLLIAPFEAENRMRLDETALRALHVFSPRNKGSEQSLFGLLSKETRTGAGKRLLEKWLRQPLRNAEQIIQRQGKVVELAEDHALRMAVQDVLRGTTDAVRVMKKILRGGGSLNEVVALHSVIEKALKILQTNGEKENGKANDSFKEFTEKLLSLLEDLTPFKDMVEQMIDWKTSTHYQYWLRADFDEQLKRINEEREKRVREMQEEAVRIGDVFGKKLKLESNAQNGYYLRISRADAQVLEKHAEFLVLSTLKSGVTFTTVALKTLSAEHEENGSEYARLQTDLVQEMLKVTQTYRAPFLKLGDLLAELDALQSMTMAFISAPGAYCVPEFSQTSEIEIQALRHPCLDSSSFIPNDLTFKQPHILSLITGPNMGGKSTFIRSVALCALLAQIGGLVPAEFCKIPLFDALFVRVGAGDDVFRGLSTFAVEMRESSTILKSATRDSLVVIDELGRGTSSEDGLALAWAMAEYLAQQIQCHCLFATHFHELTLLPNEPQMAFLVKNLHLSVHQEANDLTLLYKVRDGPGESSLGLHVAKMAGMPDEAIRMASIWLQLEEGIINEDEILSK